NAEAEGSNPFASTISFLCYQENISPVAQPTLACPRENDGRLWLAMRCPKCLRENPDNLQFCTRCHTPLRFTCPACRHVQDHSGKCEQCGVDFAKYAAMLVFQARNGAQQKRRHSKERASLARRSFLIPLTGGLSLLRYVLSRLRR